MSTTDNTFPAVRACALALLAGVVLHAEGVTAGNGILVDWRTVRSGEEIRTGDDAADLAQFFVAFVGPDAALASLDEEPPPASPVRDPSPRVHAFGPNEYGQRTRQIEFDGFHVTVAALPWMHSSDVSDEQIGAFAARLAAFCESIA